MLLLTTLHLVHEPRPAGIPRLAKAHLNGVAGARHVQQTHLFRRHGKKLGVPRSFSCPQKGLTWIRIQDSEVDRRMVWFGITRHFLKVAGLANVKGILTIKQYGLIMGSSFAVVELCSDMDPPMKFGTSTPCSHFAKSGILKGAMRYLAANLA